MVTRVFVEKRKGFDVEARHMMADLRQNLGLKAIEDLRILNRYDVSGLSGEEFEAAVNFKEACKTNNEVDPPITKIDIIQAIWEKMFPHNRLIRKSGFIELVSTGRDSNSYTAGRMSDSEKLVFYLIGAALLSLIHI